jgi:hypothetical protein
MWCGLAVRPDAPENIIWLIQREALDVPEILRGVSVSYLLVHEELADAFFARC